MQSLCIPCRYVKFDTFHPAVEKGLPVTRVISRFVLQKLLAEACEKIAGDDLIVNDCVVCDYEEKVRVLNLSRPVSDLQMLPTAIVKASSLAMFPNL